MGAPAASKQARRNLKRECEEREIKGCRSLALSPVSLSRTRTHKHMTAPRAHTPRAQQAQLLLPLQIFSLVCGSGCRGHHCLDDLDRCLPLLLLSPQARPHTLSLFLPSLVARGLGAVAPAAPFDPPLYMYVHGYLCRSSAGWCG